MPAKITRLVLAAIAPLALGAAIAGATQSTAFASVPAHAAPAYHAQDCPDGTHWDDVLGECVPNT